MSKIYIQDCGVYGCIVAVAESEEDAREMMSDEHNYDEKRSVMGYVVSPGHIHTNLGDS
jgi:hypothetical protein